MPDFASLPLENLLQEEGFDCACGRHHECGLKYLKIGQGTVKYLPEALKTLKCKKPFVVCDQNTEKAAWNQVKDVLEKNNIRYAFFRFSHDHVEPDEYAVGSLCMAYDPSCDVVLAIGSGVINDCCKVLAHARGCPSMVVGTAPSMDGYASNSSSMIQNAVKVSLYNACPAAIIADTDIMKNAPERMLLAGLGDMMAKYISICEWRISHIVCNEYYCDNIAGLVRSSLKKIVDAAPRLLSRDPDIIGAVAEGLILSGIAMAYAKISRPASGLEHYFSHMWEMMALDRGTPYELHGIQVGVGTYLTLSIYDKIRLLTPSRETAEQFIKGFDISRWQKMIHEIFGKAAGAVLTLEEKTAKNDPAKHKKRLETILSHWDDIQQVIAEELPETQKITALMKDLHMPMLPEDLGISQEDVRYAFIGSRDIRDKYLTSSMLWDLGILYTFMDDPYPAA